MSQISNQICWLIPSDRASLILAVHIWCGHAVGDATCRFRATHGLISGFWRSRVCSTNPQKNTTVSDQVQWMQNECQCQTKKHFPVGESNPGHPGSHVTWHWEREIITTRLTRTWCFWLLICLYELPWHRQTQNRVLSHTLIASLSHRQAGRTCKSDSFISLEQVIPSTVLILKTYTHIHIYRYLSRWYTHSYRHAQRGSWYSFT